MNAQSPTTPTTLALQPYEPIKMIVMAPSGYGKTCLLDSLLVAKFNVRVIDLDDGIKVLRNIASPDSLTRLSWATLTEPMKVAQGRIFPVKATVWTRAVALLEHWKHEDEHQGSVDLGPLAKWGSNDVLVIDTLSKLADAALNYHLAMNGKLGVAPTGNEHRRNIGTAQGYVNALLQLLFDTSIKCNVVINTHIVHSKEDGTMPKDDEEGAMLYGYPKAIGRSMGPNIPTYFRDVLTLKKQGSTAKLCTKGDFALGLKSCAPLRVKAEYPRETGLAQYFADVRG